MNNIFKVSVILYVIADLLYVFFLQYHNPFDGDLVDVALPSAMYEQVLNNPLGLDAVLRHQKYAGTNGYLSLAFVYHYFRIVPFFFQQFVSPISSLYMSFALFVAAMKGVYIYVFGVYISGSYKPLSKNFLIAAALITPIIQTGGYRWNMGIVDPMLICVFGYSKSNLLILIFFLPIFLVAFHGRKMKFGPVLFGSMILLAIYNGYNGPLSGPALCLIFCFLFLGMMWQNMKRTRELPFFKRAIQALISIPAKYIVLCVVALISSLYCYYLGTFNSESYLAQIPMSERYMRIPRGLYEHFSSKGLGMLSVMLLINIGMLVLGKKDENVRRMLTLLGWILLFDVIYTLSLPLGGYRFYRPYIIRRDVFSPVVVTLIAFYGISTFYLLRNVVLQYRKIYLAVVIVPLLHYAIANTYSIPDNSCERAALEKIASSPDKIVVLESDCPVAAWEKVTDYRKSADIIKMLRFWGVVKEEKYFYHK